MFNDEVVGFNTGEFKGFETPQDCSSFNTGNWTCGVFEILVAVYISISDSRSKGQILKHCVDKLRWRTCVQNVCSFSYMPHSRDFLLKARMLIQRHLSLSLWFKACLKCSFCLCVIRSECP